MARPEGLEPPTYRFEVRSNTEPQGTVGKRGSTCLVLRGLYSLPYPALLAHCGSRMVADYPAASRAKSANSGANETPRSFSTYRYLVCHPLKTDTLSSAYKRLLPRCYHLGDLIMDRKTESRPRKEKPISLLLNLPIERACEEEATCVRSTWLLLSRSILSRHRATDGEKECR